MKKFLAALCFSAICALSAEETLCTREVETTPAACSEKSGNFANMGRGIVNIGTCFLEVPRSMVYRNSQVPLWGFVGGAIEGSGLTALRAFSGVTDVLFLGFDEGMWFNTTTFRDYIWKSTWLPKEK